MSRRDYEAHKERAREYGAERSREGRDIGSIPPPANPAAKESACYSFRDFCDQYLAHTFCLEWSEDHLLVIRKIEQSVRRGGLQAIAMPRGSGKTSLCEAAVLWALLYGLHSFVVLIGAEKSLAVASLDNIKAEIEENAALEADFPEVCVPVGALEGIHQRAAGQLCCGEPTRIEWNQDAITLPTIEGSASSGAHVKVRGLTGSIRGLKRKIGEHTVRPSLFLADDPQTDQSARSVTQTQSRLAVLNGAVLGLAGPGERIAGLCPCTVIQRGDLADQLLDSKRYPDWQGTRTKLVYQWPKAVKLWEEYERIRAEELDAGGEGAQATDYYREHRDEMDAGAVVAWPARYDHESELSALQHAVNLRMRDPAAFSAEYQNDPEDPDLASDFASAAEIAARTNARARGLVPDQCEHLTLFVDVHARLLYWLVGAWWQGFGGSVVDYGCYPEQRAKYFSARQVRRTLSSVLRASKKAVKKTGLEAAIYAGLEAIVEKQMAREWKREDGSVQRIGLAMIDANWGESTDCVYEFCRRSQFAAMLRPSHGRGVGATSKPLAEYQRKKGDRLGHYWRISSGTAGRAIRHVLYDTNYYKTLVHERLAAPIGDPGAIDLYGDARTDHSLLADHLTAESPIRVEARGRSVYEWQQRADRQDNHWLDGLVGSAVAASVLGIRPLEASAAPKKKKRKVRYLE